MSEAKKVALVTGAASGIGSSAAVALAKAGYDVVINYSRSEDAAKATAAAAQQAGAKTLLIEKSSVPGGLSICSYGAVRSARDPELAFQYLKTTNGGRTPDPVLRALQPHATRQGLVAQLSHQGHGHARTVGAGGRAVGHQHGVTGVAVTVQVFA